MPAGRPSSYTPEIAAKILDELPFADGGLEEVCEAEDLPSARTVYRWLATNEEFCQQYTRARELGGEVQAQRCLRDALNAKDAQLGRLAWDARRWAASKLAAKKYGDKIIQEHSGPDGSPINMKIEDVRESLIDRITRISAAGEEAGSLRDDERERDSGDREG